MKDHEVETIKQVLNYMLECNHGEHYNHPKKHLMGELNDIVYRYSQDNEDFLRVVRDREIEQEKERTSKVGDTIIYLSIGLMFDKAYDVVKLCNEIGLNPWCLNEGLAIKETIYPIQISIAKKYGII